MLKVVVFDSGFGGELFADKLNEEIGVVEVIRVIDWRNAEKYLESKRQARNLAEKALKPFLGKVDLIIFANTLLTITSLKYFRRKYKNQKFVGLGLKLPDTFANREALVLTTKAVKNTIDFRTFLLRLKGDSATLTLDSWPSKIDDGELDLDEIKCTINKFLISKNYYPREVILACTQFSDIKTELRKVLGNNIKIYDSFNDGVRSVCSALKLRGSLTKA